MKKTLCLLLALLFVCAVPLVASASETQFSFVYDPDPAYDITIPAYIELSEEGTDVQLYVQNARYLNLGRISVTIAETKPNNNDLILKTYSESGSSRGDMKYNLVAADGTEINYKGNNKGDHIGAQLASFTGSGTKYYKVTPGPHDWSTAGTYTGSIIYDIAYIPAGA